jgi:hypothetical protein
MTLDLDHSAARASAPVTAPRGAPAATAPDVGARPLLAPSAPERSAPVARPTAVDIGAPAGGRQGDACAVARHESARPHAAPVARARAAPDDDGGPLEPHAPRERARTAPAGRATLPEYRRARPALAARPGADSSAHAAPTFRRAIGDRSRGRGGWEPTRTRVPPNPRSYHSQPIRTSVRTNTRSDRTDVRTNDVRPAAAGAHLVLGLLGLCLGLLRFA